tara:strand:+ start:463 stop:1551 length:1089 start_codon:yes stop_codon:yes gene_type:complete
MDIFNHINYKIQQIIGENPRVKFFANEYRFDPELDKIRDRIFGRGKSRPWTNLKKVEWHNAPPKDLKIIEEFINHSYEPIYCDLDKVFYDTLFQHSLPFRKFIIHSEQNSSDLNAVIGLGFEGGIHWLANGYICAEGWYRYYKDIDQVCEYVPLEHKFICPVRLFDNKRVYRIKFLNLINTENGLYSLFEKDPQTGATIQEVYPSNVVSPNSFDEHTNSSAWINFKEKGNPTCWKTSFLHVVLETVVDRVHLTEKIFKPIVLKHPFVLLNGVGGLEYLRSYGFKTFNDFWDEDYDNIEDLDSRMRAIADIVNYIGDRSISELEKIREKMKPILEYNYNWFYNGFTDKCWNELETNLNKAIQK